MNKRYLLTPEVTSILGLICGLNDDPTDVLKGQGHAIVASF